MNFYQKLIAKALIIASMFSTQTKAEINQIDPSEVELEEASHIDQVKKLYLSQDAAVLSTSISSLSAGKTKLSIVEKIVNQEILMYSVLANGPINLFERDSELAQKIKDARSRALIKNSAFFKYRQLFGEDANLSKKLNYLETKSANIYNNTPEHIANNLAKVVMINSKLQTINSDDLQKKYLILKNHLNTQGLIIKEVSQSKRSPGKAITVKINYDQFQFDLRLNQIIQDQSGELAILTFQLYKDKFLFTTTGERYGVSAPEKHSSLATYIKDIADNQAKNTP